MSKKGQRAAGHQRSLDRKLVPQQAQRFHCFTVTSCQLKLLIKWHVENNTGGIKMFRFDYLTGTSTDSFLTDENNVKFKREAYMLICSPDSVTLTTGEQENDPSTALGIFF